jgi:hypothetical protein
MRARTLAIGAILSAGVANGASAQAPGAMPAVSNKRVYHFGAQVGVTYDTNSTRGSTANAMLRGLEKADTTVTPSVTADISQPFGRQVLFLRGAAGYDFHLRNKQLDNQAHDISGGAIGLVGPCQPALQGTYQARQSDLGDADLRTTKNRQEVTGVNLGISCGLGRGPGGSVSVGRLETKNSAADLVEQDSTTENLAVALTYAVPTLVNASLVFNYGNSEFPNRIIPGRPIGDGFFQQVYGIRLDRQFGSRIQTGVTFSRTHLKREFAPPGEPLAINANTYQADMAYRLNDRINFTLAGGRSVRPSNRVGKLYDISESLQGQASYRLNSRFNVSVGHVYEDIVSNTDSASARLVVTNAITNTTYATFSISRIGPGTLQFDVRRQRRDTNLPLFDYKATRVGLIAKISY